MIVGEGPIPVEGSATDKTRAGNELPVFPDHGGAADGEPAVDGDGAGVLVDRKPSNPVTSVRGNLDRKVVVPQEAELGSGRVSDLKDVGGGVVRPGLVHLDAAVVAVVVEQNGVRLHREAVGVVGGGVDPERLKGRDAEQANPGGAVPYGDDALVDDVGGPADPRPIEDPRAEPEVSDVADGNRRRPIEEGLPGPGAAGAGDDVPGPVRRGSRRGREVAIQHGQLNERIEIEERLVRGDMLLRLRFLKQKRAGLGSRRHCSLAVSGGVRRSASRAAARRTRRGPTAGRRRPRRSSPARRRRRSVALRSTSPMARRR